MAGWWDRASTWSHPKMFAFGVVVSGVIIAVVGHGFLRWPNGWGGLVVGAVLALALGAYLTWMTAQARRRLPEAILELPDERQAEVYAAVRKGRPAEDADLDPAVLAMAEHRREQLDRQRPWHLLVLILPALFTLVTQRFGLALSIFGVIPLAIGQNARVSRASCGAARCPSSTG